VPDFFWVAAQAGHVADAVWVPEQPCAATQKKSAMGQACAALLRGEALPQHLADFGLTPAMLSPARLRPA